MRAGGWRGRAAAAGSLEQPSEEKQGLQEQNAKSDFRQGDSYSAQEGPPQGNSQGNITAL